MLYLIEVTSRVGWDEWNGWVVRASNEDQALDSSVYGYGDGLTIREYLQEDFKRTYSIKPIEDGPVATILGSFRAG